MIKLLPYILFQKYIYISALCQRCRNTFVRYKCKFIRRIRGLFTDFTFQFSLFHFLAVGSVLWIIADCVRFRAHFKVASSIIIVNKCQPAAELFSFTDNSDGKGRLIVYRHFGTVAGINNITSQMAFLAAYRNYLF